MILVAGFQDHSDHAGGDLGFLIFPVMVDADDIRAAVRHHLEHMPEASGLIGDFGGQFHQAPGFGEALGDDPGESCHIHIAAGDNADRFPAIRRRPAKHTGGDRGSARALGNGFLFLHQGQNRGSNLVL